MKKYYTLKFDQKNHSFKKEVLRRKELKEGVKFTEGIPDAQALVSRGIAINRA